MDVIGSAVALTVAMPALLISALLVRRSLGTPVVLRQVRAGLDGRSIVISKFRTMSDARTPSGVLLPDHQRLTELGRRLRSRSLDELPQLVAVLKGDMSLVGPRPLPVAYVPRYGERQRRRLAARPGLTGWAQVSGRNALSWPEKLELDVWYVENASLLLDLQILVRTIRAMIAPAGVSAEGHATMPEFMGER